MSGSVAQVVGCGRPHAGHTTGHTQPHERPHAGHAPVTPAATPDDLPDLHLREFWRHRTLPVVDEVNHLPALADTDPDAASEAAIAGKDQASAWSRAILPLREAFLRVRDLRARRRKERGLAPGEAALGLGKVLVVAPDQENARRYLELVRQWIPADQAQHVAQLATSDTPWAHEAVAAFRLRPEPSVLVTVAMAYEGLDVPEVAVVAALTHIRSRPWLEQMSPAPPASTRMPGPTRRSAPWCSIPTTR